MDITFRQSRRAAFTLTDLIALVVVVGLGVSLVLPWRHGAQARSSRIRCVSNLKQVGLAFKVFAGDNGDYYPFGVTNGYAAGEQKMAWRFFQAMSNELSTAKVLLCPDDVTRAVAATENFKLGTAADARSLSVLGNSGISYFVNITADETRPQSPLSGDRNIAPRYFRAVYSTMSMGAAILVTTNSEWSSHRDFLIHTNGGNLLQGDGSVNQSVNQTLQNQLILAEQAYGTNSNRFLFPQ